MQNFPEILVCKENKRKFILHTQKYDFFKERLDKKEKANNKKECDYLITSNNENIQIFIELKGNKRGDALKQILSSYEKHKIENFKYFVAIVSSKVPQMDTSTQILLSKVNKYFKDIFIKNNILKTKYNPSTNNIEKTN